METVALYQHFPSSFLIGSDEHAFMCYKFLAVFKVQSTVVHTGLLLNYSLDFFQQTSSVGCKSKGTLYQCSEHQLSQESNK